MWTPIKTQDDIESLMQAYNGFHDSCIRRITITTKENVNEDLSMSFDNECNATILYQRQSNSSSVIEICFKDVIKLNFVAIEENYLGFMLDAYFKIENGIVYWAEMKEWNFNDLQKDSIRWVSSKNAEWRIVEELIGKV